MRFATVNAVILGLAPNLARPDWPRLRDTWRGSSLLHEGVTWDFIREREGRQIACLATPLTDFDGGAVLAADLALEWIRACGEGGLVAIAPAVVAGLANCQAGNPDACINASDYAIVPPSDDWQSSIDVWRVVYRTLAAVKPVYILKEAM